MLTLLVIVYSSTVVEPPTARPITPQCEYYRYMSAAVWSALNDAERAGASFMARNNLEITLRSVVAGQRKACP